MAERVVWVDASSGASSDLLLAALIDAGIPIGVLAEAIEKVAPDAWLHEERVRRGDVTATCCRLEVQHISEPRTWRDVEAVLAGAGLHEDVRSLAHDVFARLAEEKSAQGLPIEEVPFHDEGSLLAIADVVGICAGLVHLAAPYLVVSPGPAELEKGTPVGTALLTALADDWGPRPAMRVSQVGTGAAWRQAELPPRLLRVSVGERDPRPPASLGEG